MPEIGPEYEQHFDETSAVRGVALTGEPLNEPDAPSSPVLDQKLAERYNAASALFVPLAFDGQVRAVIGCISEVQREFTDERRAARLHARQPGRRRDRHARHAQRA